MDWAGVWCDKMTGNVMLGHRSAILVLRFILSPDVLQEII